MYISLLIYNIQKLSPTLLWVSKFDPKLGSLDLIFKTIVGNVFLKNHAESKFFKSTENHKSFLSKSDVKLGSWGMIHTGDHRLLNL